MGHPYYRQAKFAKYRFQAKDRDSVKAHEAAYLESKEVERFAGVDPEKSTTTNRLERKLPKKPLSPSTIAYQEAKARQAENAKKVETKEVEVFCQCLECLSVMTIGTSWPQYVKCRYCRGAVETLTIDGVPT